MSTIAAIHLRRLPNAWHMLAILLALGGVFLIATGGDFHHVIISPLALVFGFGSAACSVLYTILPSAQIRKWGTLPVNALAMLIGGMALGLIITPWRASLNLDFSGWMAIAFIVLIGTVASFTLFLRGVGDIGPVKATFIGTLEPLSATVCSFSSPRYALYGNGYYRFCLHSGYGVLGYHENSLRSFSILFSISLTRSQGCYIIAVLLQGSNQYIHMYNSIDILVYTPGAI